MRIDTTHQRIQENSGSRPKMRRRWKQPPAALHRRIQRISALRTLESAREKFITKVDCSIAWGRWLFVGPRFKKNAWEKTWTLTFFNIKIILLRFLTWNMNLEGYTKFLKKFIAPKKLKYFTWSENRNFCFWRDDNNLNDVHYFKVDLLPFKYWY